MAQDGVNDNDLTEVTPETDDEDCDIFKSMELIGEQEQEQVVMGNILMPSSAADAEADRRNSILNKFDPLLVFSNSQQPEIAITEPDDVVKPKLIELDLVNEHSLQQVEHMDKNGFGTDEEHTSEIDKVEGERHTLDETFTLGDGDSLATENWYSLETNPNQIDICQDESHHHKENQLLKAKVAELELTIANHSNLNGGHALAITDYETKLSRMTDSADEWKARAMSLDRDKVVLIRDRDQAKEDLLNVEAAFSDLHRKYERVKEVLKNSHLNQKLLESRDYELQERLKSATSHISELEEEYKEKLSSVYSSFEARLKNQELETTRLRAQLRKLQMKNETLENEVKQKSSEVSKLSSLCDELINKV